MKIDLEKPYITLDWDNISLAECKRRLFFIRDLPYLVRYTCHFSGTKGFHIRIWFSRPVLVAKMRKELKDDGRRLVNDILNRDGNIHDILWRRKTVDGIVWQERLIYSYNK